ncbi:DUF481 domain-containing protein [Gemmatimonas aurantiaca]|uniref:DUF481 domain-containing protein n=1 Tax=Gemmatimonas aurantiaca TaxID=173480 RepID=UPI00301E57D6
MPFRFSRALLVSMLLVGAWPGASGHLDAQSTAGVSTGSPTTTMQTSKDGKPSSPVPAKKKAVDFTASMGYAQTQGNATARNINVGNTLTYRAAGWIVRQDLAFMYGEANDKVSTNFWNGGIRGDRTLMNRVALFMASRYDRNVPQGVANRFQQGIGINVLAFDDSHNKLNVAVGGSLFSQDLLPGVTAKVSRAFPAARAAVDYRYRFNKLAFLQHTAEYLPAVGDTATAYFVNTESTIVAPISRNVGLKVGYVIRYNSEPPVRNDQQLRTTDMFFSSGLTLTFR